MIIIQDNIQNLKYYNKKQIGVLDKELNDLTDELNYYNEKMLTWTEPVQINFYQMSNLRKPKGIKNKHQCKVRLVFSFDCTILNFIQFQEVKEFIEFVHSSGGHENGWRREDHQLFIKFRKKYKNIDTIARHLNEEFPGNLTVKIYFA